MQHLEFHCGLSRTWKFKDYNGFTKKRTISCGREAKTESYRRFAIMRVTVAYLIDQLGDLIVLAN